MVTLLITSVLILVLFSIAIYIWQRPRVSQPLGELPPPPDARALFGDPGTPETAQIIDQDLRNSLVAQASQGDKTTLKKAHELSDQSVYDQVLSALVNAPQSEAHILSLTSYVTRNQWPVNTDLATAVIHQWQQAPDRSSTAKMLHIAALSDDAKTYTNAVELALRFWREGKISDLPAVELNALLTGEFWLLSSATRSSGAGFILKRSLASARQELERTKNAN